MRMFEALRLAGFRAWGWLDVRATDYLPTPDNMDRIEWQRVVPYLMIHLACVGVLWVGVSTTAVLVALATYAVRMFAITGFYHRYFAHRSFRTSRGVQFIFAVLGDTAGQRGPIWWSAQHRRHHRHSDTPQDAHSPKYHGFWWSHLWWPTSRRNFRTCLEAVKDLARYPELVLVDRFHALPPLILAFGLYGLGAGLQAHWPGLRTDGLQLAIWGFFISTVCVYHSTFAINSVAHLWGSRRYATSDDSRNSFLLALLTFGEGWHNNHHYHPRSARQGFYWWEVDITYYLLKVMEWLGLVWDLHRIPEARRRAGRVPGQACQHVPASS